LLLLQDLPTQPGSTISSLKLLLLLRPLLLLLL
jgi:hypothetical protein